MKKIVVLLLCLCLLMTGALAEITYPIEDGPTLKVWIELNAGASQMFTNYGDNPLYQQLQEVTGVKLEFVHPTYGANAEGFSTMIANMEEWPDIIINFSNYYNGGTVAALDDGVIYDLTPYLEEYAPDYYALINRDAKTHIEFYNEEEQCLAFYTFALVDSFDANSLVVRADWCEEWGIDPASLVTYDDLEVYFQKVLEEKPGVVPFMPALSNADFRLITLWGYNLKNDFYAEDGEIKYYAVQPSYQKWLKTMHDWYDKGYIGTDFVAQKNAVNRKQFAAGEIGCITVAIGNGYADAQAAGIKIDKIPYPRETADTIIHTHNLGVNVNVGYEAVVTTNCPEELLPKVCEFLNYPYTEEGMIFSNWGPEGLSWNWNEDHTKRVHSDWVLHNPDNTTSVMHNVCRMTYWPRAQMNELECNPNIAKDEIITDMRQRYHGEDYMQHDYTLPRAVDMLLDVDEVSERDGILVDVEAYVSENMFNFIRGDLDIDADWDNYVKTLERYKLSRAIELEQTAYDRYLERIAEASK